jgi:hypothetical protein
MREFGQLKTGSIMNITQAIKALESGKDVLFIKRYFDCSGSIVFPARFYGDKRHHEGFKHIISCEKSDFRSMCTYHRGNRSFGNKKNCKFEFKIFEKEKTI